MSEPCVLTPTRLVWLQLLAKQGTTRWQRMPRGSNRTWVPMVGAGWITSQCHAPRNGLDPFDHYFTITDAGRAIAKAQGGAT